MDYTALGHTANLAARMEQIAEPGRIYLAEATAQMCQGFFALRDLGRHEVRGLSQPVVVFELEGVGRMRTRLEVSRARGFSKFVGRQSEMAVLETALEQDRTDHQEGMALELAAPAEPVPAAATNTAAAHRVARSRPAVHRRWHQRGRTSGRRRQLHDRSSAQRRPVVKMGQSDQGCLGSGWHTLENPPGSVQAYRWCKGRCWFYLQPDAGAQRIVAKVASPIRPHWFRLFAESA
jgi:hypothetical protein